MVANLKGRRLPRGGISNAEIRVEREREKRLKVKTAILSGAFSGRQVDLERTKAGVEEILGGDVQKVDPLIGGRKNQCLK